MLANTALDAAAPSPLLHTGVATKPTNPWVSDPVLLGVALWWVENTRPNGPDLSSEVGLVFRSLQRDLQ